MPSQWGFINIPRASLDAAMRAEFLIGYPFAFGIPVVPPIPPILIDPNYYRPYLGDALDLSGGSATELIVTYDNLQYLKDYIQ